MVLATVAPQSPPSQTDPFERDRTRFQRYREYGEFYEGVQWLGKPRRGEKRIVVNYARALVRKVVSYALPAGVGFSVAPAVLAGDVSAGDDPSAVGRNEAADVTRARQQAGEEQANRVEGLLAELLAELEADRIDFDLAIDAAVYGDGVIKVTWDTVAARPRLTAVDPRNLLAWWSPDTPGEAYRFTQRYTLPGAAIEELGWARTGDMLPEKMYPVHEDWTGERWTVSVGGQTALEQANPYGWLPYLVLANNSRASQFWGESDLPDLIDLCRELNARLSTLGQVLELSGAPIAVLENVDGSEGISVGPGAKWELPEGSKAYLLDLLAGNGVRLHIEYLEQLRTSIHDLAETPRTAFGEGGRTIAGTALEVEMQPLVQKVNRMRRGMDALYRRRNAMVLDLMERFGGAPIGGLRRTVTVWPPILPSDREVEARVGVQLVNAQVRSRRSVAADLGEEDPDAELTRIIEEAGRLAGGEGEAADGQEERPGPGAEENEPANEAGEGQEAGEQGAGAEEAAGAGKS